LGALATQPAALTLGESTPDTELFTIGQGVLEAFATNNAAFANFFGFAGAGTTLGEEEIGVNAKAVCLVLPAAFLT
jgi:hypothetical protein